MSSTPFSTRTSRSVRQGFSLTEVIVAIGILVTVVISATNLLVSITRGNNVNEHTLVAHALAQEGLEGMRNIRDSNWLLNADFSGKISSKSSVSIWGEDNAAVALPELNQTAYYLLNYHRLDAASPFDVVTSASQLNFYVPWTLTPLSNFSTLGPEQDSKSGRLFLQKDKGNPDLVRYVHHGTTQEIPSLYRRLIKVEALGYDKKKDQKVYKYLITSLVFWTEDQMEKSVRLTTELTDWKGGPL